MAEEHSQITDLKAVVEEVKEGPHEGPLSAAERTLIRVMQANISHSGPLPGPETLAGYERVVPGAGERIITMAERQSAHRHEMERIVIRGGVKAQFLGAVLAFVLAITGILLGAILLLKGHDLGGFGFFVTSLAALVGTFIFGRVDQRKERQEKQAPAVNEAN